MLDVTAPNQLALVSPMPRTRTQDLADYYLKAAGVAAIWIDADGFIGAHGAATIEGEPGCITYCCLRGKHFALAYQVHEWKTQQTERPVAEVTARKLEHMADLMGVGLTKHHVAVERARAAVAAVNQAIDAMAERGELREFNAAFKEARKVDPSIRYQDYLHARKAAMLEAMAREASR